MIGIEKQLLKGASVSQHIIGHVEKTAVSLVDVIDLTVAATKDGNALKHGDQFVRFPKYKSKKR